MMRCIALAYAQDKTITVFAAASMKNALGDVDVAFNKQTGIGADEAD
jgi:molybdate transport system substrate-binding protein